jgi:hypothetical protein
VFRLLHCDVRRLRHIDADHCERRKSRATATFNDTLAAMEPGIRRSCRGQNAHLQICVVAYSADFDAEGDVNGGDERRTELM